MDKEKEIQDRVIVWKNLRLIVKDKHETQPEVNNQALLVLVGAESKTHE